ncbi:MAG: hypothetical protein DRO09_00195 [Thermoprotei archaeon]|nr:MAG: hypothetical protein DRO09_00195 [Thermoprotei archaeon]
MRKAKEEKVRVPVYISKSAKELLEREFGSVSKGVEELAKRYEFSLGPKDPELRRAWEVLLQHLEEPGEIKWSDALAVLFHDAKIPLPRGEEVLKQLSAEGYVEMARPGVLKVHRKKAFPGADILALVGLG